MSATARDLLATSKLSTFNIDYNIYYCSVFRLLERILVERASMDDGASMDDRASMDDSGLHS
jgi:hypothetical protein